jgi:hypothetical protein
MGETGSLALPMNNIVFQIISRVNCLAMFMALGKLVNYSLYFLFVAIDFSGYV